MGPLRWEVVANFIHQHNAQKRKRTAKEVLAKAKDLKASDFSKNSMKEEANDKAYDAFEKNINKAHVRVEAEETKRGM
jgi:DnaJ family protein C protein 2